MDKSSNSINICSLLETLISITFNANALRAPDENC